MGNKANCIFAGKIINYFITLGVVIGLSAAVMVNATSASLLFGTATVIDTATSDSAATALAASLSGLGFSAGASAGTSFPTLSSSGTQSGSGSSSDGDKCAAQETAFYNATLNQVTGHIIIFAVTCVCSFFVCCVDSIILCCSRNSSNQASRKKCVQVTNAVFLSISFACQVAALGLTAATKGKYNTAVSCLNDPLSTLGLALALPYFNAAIAEAVINWVVLAWLMFYNLKFGILFDGPADKVENVQANVRGNANVNVQAGVRTY